MEGYVCKKCGKTGTKKDVPYRIIDNRDDRIVFKGQLCDDCFKKIFDSPHLDEQTKKK